jgi:hypothetical protein
VRSKVVRQSTYLVGLFAVVCTLGYARQAPSQFGTARIAWRKQLGVTRYRLQIADDNRFQDVLFEIWQSDEDAAAAKANGVNTRTVAVSRVSDSRLMVVSNNGSTAGLCAVEIL